MTGRAPPLLRLPLRRSPGARGAARVRLRPLPGARAAPQTSVAVQADADGLTLRFACAARRLTARMLNDGDPLYLEDVVEVFLWPGGDPAVYLEYEVSPLGRDLCLLCCQQGGARSAWRPWGTAAAARPSCRVAVRGGAQRHGAAVRGWDADVRIPFAALAGIAPAPVPGTRWRANLYRIDHAAGAPRHAAWSPPPRADFHHLDSFATIAFTEQP